MSEWYVRCLDVSEGQVKDKSSKDRSRQVSGGCLAVVLRVSGGYPWDVRMVCELSRCI